MRGECEGEDEDEATVCTDMQVQDSGYERHFALCTFSPPSPPGPTLIWQVDVIGHNIRDLVHPQDFMEVAHIFSDHEPMVKPGG